MPYISITLPISRAPQPHSGLLSFLKHETCFCLDLWLCQSFAYNALPSNLHRLPFYFIQVSVQMPSTQRGLPGPSYLNSNTPLSMTCYFSTTFYHSLNSTALHYIIYFLFLFPAIKCFLGQTLYFSAVQGGTQNTQNLGKIQLLLMS